MQMNTTAELTVRNSKGELKEGVPIEPKIKKTEIPEAPPIGTEFQVDDKLYRVTYVNKTWFTCKAIGHSEVLVKDRIFLIGTVEYKVIITNETTRKFSASIYLN